MTVRTVVQKILAKRPVYLDTETTGLTARDEVVEVAVIDWDGEVLFDELIRPTRRIPEQATAVHGLTNAMVEMMPDFMDVLPRLAYVLEEREVVSYNADFDLRMLCQSARAHGQDLYCHLRPVVWHCAMNLYAAFWGRERWQRLAGAARQQGIALQAGLHRARTDAELTRLVFMRMGGEDA